MRKLILALAVAIIIAVGFFIYSEQRIMVKHPTIQSCENVVQNALKAPDTYSLRTATMIVTNGTDQPRIILDFRYKNQFGVESKGEATCTFTQGISDIAVNDYLFKLNKWKPNNIKSKISPFESFDLNEVMIDGIPINMNKVTQQSIWLNKHRKDVHVDYLPGKIVGQETPHTYVFSSGTYVYEEKPIIIKIVEKYLPQND